MMGVSWKLAPLSQAWVDPQDVATEELGRGWRPLTHVSSLACWSTCYGCPPAGLKPIRDFKGLCPQKTPTFMIRPVPTILPEGSEINRRKSNPDRECLIAWEGIELELSGVGCLGDSFIELDKAGWGWTLTSFYLEGHPGETDFFGVRGRSVPGPVCATSASTTLGTGRNSVKAEQVQTPGIFMPRPKYLPHNFACMIEKWQEKCLLSFYFVSPFFWSPTENTGDHTSDVINRGLSLRPERMWTRTCSLCFKKQRVSRCQCWSAPRVR